MGRRIALVVALCAILPVLLFAALAAWEADSSSAGSRERELAGISHLYSEVIRSRIGAAETLVLTLTANDVGYDGAGLKRRVANSSAFKSVVVVDRDGLLAGGEAALRPSPAQLVALEAGETVLLPVTLEGQLTSAYLVQAVNAAGVGRLAYFELAPDWLWKRVDRIPVQMTLAVVDADAKVLYNVGPLSADAAHIFADHITLSSERSGTLHSISWQDGGAGWHGVVQPLQLANERITAVPWAVVSFGREETFFARSQHVWRLLPYIMVLVLLCALAGAFYLSSRYLPALRALRTMAAALRERRFDAASVSGADELRDLGDDLNRSMASLREHFHALETLGEIDKLLLGSAELEQVLDAVLSRVQSVTRCDCVGITLRDADAPGRGRVYLAGSELSDLPVRRVELDEDMITRLGAENVGLTVTRCEDTRHSFLKPMEDIGAEFFWVWPVSVAERVEAILAVGYRETPAPDPYMAHAGTQFAERLGVALSKSARDERLYRQAHYDPLTALPNRILFRDRLAQELANSTAGLSRGALLYIDLDHFKRVNDSVGHSAGDQLLAIVAQRLRSCTKEGDTVARLGGDEFTVILRNVGDPDAAKTVGDRIIQLLQLPVNIAGRDHFVCASIGVTLFPDDGSTIDDLMRNADTAMYRAKDSGRGCTMFFDPNLSGGALAATETGLQRALRRREFSLFYQPQFSVSDGALAGVEALLRWQTPRDGLRPPEEFVPAAEESGLIVDIGGWVVEAACAQLAAWREQNIAPPRVALNVSAQQLQHIDFPRMVQRALDKYAIPPALLELELTESVFADEAAGATLGRLAQLGVHLALDDFGTGYSSLSYLRQYPIGTVKIDRTFLEEVPQSAASGTLVETIIVMAHALGKRVVAEGVETVEQLNFLRERRCDAAQGFFLARPLSGQIVTELLQARTMGSSPESSDMRAAG
ncbi:MAG TPA: EAL domain-containing protein [Steroidobacteraceae bacterium]|nr:EAL domain-containing protein [Steroidobacteraceae bacterium]